MRKLIVGVDPGDKTGIFYMVDGKFIKCETLDPISAMDILEKVFNQEDWQNAIAVVENPNLNKPVFLSRKMEYNVFASYRPTPTGKPSPVQSRAFRSALRIAQNVGMNKKTASILIQYLEKIGYIVQQVKPSKASGTKLNATQFKKMTGFEGKTNEHTRDAGMLILKYI